MAHPTPVSSAQPGRFEFSGQLLYKGANVAAIRMVGGGYWFSVLPVSATYVVDDFGTLVKLNADADRARMACQHASQNLGAAEYDFQRAQDQMRQAHRAAHAADEALSRARTGLQATLPPEVHA